MKVLILSITAGEGHNSTAAAIKDCFAAHGDTAEVFDAYRYVSKALYESVKQGYLLVSKDFKTLFAKSYAMAENRRAGGQNGKFGKCDKKWAQFLSAVRQPGAGPKRPGKAAAKKRPAQRGAKRQKPIRPQPPQACSTNNIRCGCPRRTP